MKKSFLTTVLSAVVLFSGCSTNPPQPPKAYKGTIDNSAFGEKEKQKILNKSLNDMTEIAQKSAQIGITPSQDNCFVWDAAKPNDTFRGSMTSCYTIASNEIILNQEFKCFKRDKAGNEKESNECAFGVVPHTERYVKFIDTISQYVVTAYNENVKAIVEAPQRAAREKEEYQKTLDEIVSKSYAELEGQSVNIVSEDEFGHKKVEKTCKVQVKYNLAIANNKYEPIELYKTQFSNYKISLGEDIVDYTPKAYHPNDYAKARASFSSSQGKVDALINRGVIPPTFQIEVASKTGSYSMSASESAGNVMFNVDNYLTGGTRSENINRQLLLSALLISTGKYTPTLTADCKIYPSSQSDVNFLILLHKKEPKALKFYGMIRNKDHQATDKSLLKNREVAEIFEQIKKIATGN